MSPDLVVWFICLAEGVCFLHRLSYTAKGKVASIKSRKFIQNSGIGAQTVVSALVIDKSDIVDREEVQIVAEVRKADGIRLNGRMGHAGDVVNDHLQRGAGGDLLIMADDFATVTLLRTVA